MGSFGAALLSLACAGGGDVDAEPPARQAVPVGSPAWNLEDCDSEVVFHQGRESLLVRSGLAWLPDVELENGILEFDVSLPDARGYIGAAWRIQDEGNYEHFYLRPHRTGKPDASQYTPVFNRWSAWQLLAGPESAAPLDFSFYRWTQVRIVFWGARAQVYVDSGVPILNARLRRSPESGAIGLTVPGFAPAHFSNVRYSALTKAPFETSLSPETPTPGALPRWSVSSAFAESRIDEGLRLDGDLLDGLSWSVLDADARGLVNLARRQGVTPQRNTCLARVKLVSEDERLVPLDFGFSDRVRVFLNGRLLFVGDDTYGSRDHRFLGTIGTYDRLVLPLRAGANELVFAVAETFGGWGLLARLPPDAPIRVDPPAAR